MFHVKHSPSRVPCVVRSDVKGKRHVGQAVMLLAGVSVSLAALTGCMASLQARQSYCALQVVQFQLGNISKDSARALVKRTGSTLVDSLGGLACVHPVVHF